jgi:hypothetical protein
MGINRVLVCVDLRTHIEHTAEVGDDLDLLCF